MDRGSFSRIGSRFAAPAALAMLVLVALLAYLQYRHEQQGAQVYDGYADLLSRFILDDLRDGMLSKDRPRIQRELARLADMAPIRSARVVDKQGRVAFASDPSVLGTVMSRKEPSCVACHRRGVPAERRAHVLRFEAEGRRVHRVVQPITLDHACLTCHEEREGAVVGVLITDLDDDLLTGGMRAESARSAWALAALLLLLVGAGAAVLWRQVVTRLRNVLNLLDLIRGGARASVLSVRSADEIDEITRAVQALTLDLDGRVALEQAGRRIAPVLERETGAVLLVDAAGWVFTANHAAIERWGGARSLVGQHRNSLADSQPELLDQAREDGWALPAADIEGPAVVALADAQGRCVAFLELWSPRAIEPYLAEATSIGPPPNDPPIWLLYSAVLTESIRPAAQRGATVLRFDPRLARARRMAGDLVALGVEAALHRERVDLKSLGLILLWDLQHDLPNVHWHVLRKPSEPLLGARSQLRALLDRLARAAGQQAGPGGHVVLYAQTHPDGERLFVAAWAQRGGPSVLVHPPEGPALAQAIARAHGGDVEVDPAFDMQSIPGFAALRLGGTSVGTLFVAELAHRSEARQSLA
jgi:hypothetical protein